MLFSAWRSMHVIAAGVLLAGSAQAQIAAPPGVAFGTGASLLAICQSGNRADQTFCDGYIVAIYEVMNNGDRVQGWSACPPSTTSRPQVRDAVVGWRSRNPQHRAHAEFSVVAWGISELFPCRR